MQRQHSKLLGKDHRLGGKYGPVQLNVWLISLESESIEQLLHKWKFIEQEKNKEFLKDMFYFVQRVEGQIFTKN